jgi:hypothetical protein
MAIGLEGRASAGRGWVIVSWVVRRSSVQVWGRPRRGREVIVVRVVVRVYGSWMRSSMGRDGVRLRIVGFLVGVARNILIIS